MLALRRLATARPLARSCSFMADLKSMEAAAGKLAPQMPASLQDLATQGVRFSSPNRTLEYKLIQNRCRCCAQHTFADMRFVALPQAGITAEVSKFAAEKPDLYKAFLAKCAEVCSSSSGSLPHPL